MFELTRPTTVFLDNCKPRQEHHGEALVLAIDLKVTWTTNNRALNVFHPKLIEAMFSATPTVPTDPEDQAELELPVSEFPFILFPFMEYPLKWSKDYEGYTLRLDYGMGGESDTVLSLCKIKNLRFTPIEGGSCEIEFSISSAADISGAILGRFSELMQHDIVITLLAPALHGEAIDSSAGSGAPGVGDDEQKKLEAPPQKKTSKARQSAEDEFIRQHGGAADTPPVH